MRWVSRTATVLLAAVLGAAVTTALRPEPEPPRVLDPVAVGFAQDMSGHHQQAVTMADMLASDAGPEIRAVAEQIRFTQLNEIGQMTGWLQLSGAPPAAPAPMAWLAGAHGHHQQGGPPAMPGMATPQDLVRLQRASGRPNEILFLQLMIRHHQGGIDMAAHAAAATATDAVRRAAAVMVTEQSQDVAVMATLLAQRRAAPLPYP